MAEPDAGESGGKPPLDATRQSIQAIRDDLGKFGTGLGIGSSIFLGGTAVLNFDSLFPLPQGWPWWVALVMIFVAAAAGSVLLTRRFFVARRRVVIDTMDYGDEESLDGLSERKGGLSDEERLLVRRRFDELAHEEGARNVVAVERRGERLIRIASAAALRGDEQIATWAKSEGERLLAGVSQASAEAGLKVIERRSAQVYKGVGTGVLAVVTALGVVGGFVLADFSKGEREKAESWVACQQELKDDQPAFREEVCRQLLSEAKEAKSGVSNVPPTADPAEVKVDKGFLSRLNTCWRTASVAGIPEELRLRAVERCAGLSPAESE
ncbi:hypothetical protein [Tessaracoccus caeni]|uniref:hypothetical protein n=1 Tax=Tessaracoccus caeni TaxID=3031239 RepID=UPI0023DAF7E8|nr:hypothetical protein [Tessaracoccus caeni]MDF1487242.1 hypothetical protein [Tessaracoccus caeni]